MPLELDEVNLEKAVGTYGVLHGLLDDSHDALVEQLQDDGFCCSSSDSVLADELVEEHIIQETDNCPTVQQS